MRFSDPDDDTVAAAAHLEGKAVFKWMGEGLKITGKGLKISHPRAQAPVNFCMTLLPTTPNPSNLWDQSFEADLQFRLAVFSQSINRDSYARPPPTPAILRCA